MNTPSRIITTSGKAALLASFLFCMTIIVLENETIDGIPLIFILSIIITFIISSIMILFTIVPFHELTPSLTMEQRFKRYFPFYAIIFFLGCSCIVWSQNFVSLTNIIFAIAYVTAMQSWVWFFKQNKLKNENK